MDQFMQQLQAAGQLPASAQGFGTSVASSQDPSTGVGNRGSGFLTHIANGGAFGFLKPTDGSPDVFCLPPKSGFPALNTLVSFTMVVDQKNGKLRADDLMVDSLHAGLPGMGMPGMGMAEQVMQNQFSQNQFSSSMAPQNSVPMLGDVGVGALAHIAGGGGFGFVKPENGGADVFCLPPQGGFPPVGTRVTYSVALDAKNGKLRADNIEAASEQVPPSFGTNFAPQVMQIPQPQLMMQSHGVLGQAGDPGFGVLAHIAKDGKFGFVKPDNGGPDIFALPPRTGFCPIGSRVTYTLEYDQKNGKLRADNLQMDTQAPMTNMQQQQMQHVMHDFQQQMATSPQGFHSADALPSNMPAIQDYAHMQLAGTMSNLQPDSMPQFDQLSGGFGAALALGAAGDSAQAPGNATAFLDAQQPGGYGPVGSPGVLGDYRSSPYDQHPQANETGSFGGGPIL